MDAQRKPIIVGLPMRRTCERGTARPCELASAIATDQKIELCRVELKLLAYAGAARQQHVNSGCLLSWSKRTRGSVWKTQLA